MLPYQRDWQRPKIDWGQIQEEICKHGIRNAAQTTIAPTGTIATIAGCEGYGCEPVFALSYVRHVNDNGNELHLQYTSPSFKKALERSGVDEETQEEIIKRVLEEGNCQNIPEVPEHVREVFVISENVSSEEHVRMQAALQAFVDNSLSKTINFPENALEDDIASAYKLAWELGCKGLTVYVTGSRQAVVLETQATSQKKNGKTDSADGKDDSWTLWYEDKKPRPRRLQGFTYKINTPLGKTFVTINENGGRHPFEIFISTAKAGSDTAAVSEAIGRLLSYILRLASPVSPRERLIEIIRQLAGIGGGRPLGFGPNRVRSLPDGVAQAIREYLDDTQEDGLDQDQLMGMDPREEFAASYDHPASRIGDLCPECGQAALVNEEGCRKCYACKFSEC
jgi:ribonucleoside-diphosphate reductase alpha chain